MTRSPAKVSKQGVKGPGVGGKQPDECLAEEEGRAAFGGLRDSVRSVGWRRNATDSSAGSQSKQGSREVGEAVCKEAASPFLIATLAGSYLAQHVEQSISCCGCVLSS